MHFSPSFKLKLSTGEFDGKPRAFAGMTLSQFHDATQADLTLIAADTTWQRMLLLNHRTAPQLPVVYAVRMSMSVPLLWEEVVWRVEWGPYSTWDSQLQQLTPNDMTGHEIVDGGLLSNFPIALFMASRADVAAVVGPAKANNVLGLLIDETLAVPDCPPKAAPTGLAASVGGMSVFRRLSLLANTATCAHDNMAKAVFAANIVRLPAKGYGTTQFDMTDAERRALIACMNGVNARSRRVAIGREHRVGTARLRDDLVLLEDDLVLAGMEGDARRRERLRNAGVACDGLRLVVPVREHRVDAELHRERGNRLARMAVTHDEATAVTLQRGREIRHGLADELDPAVVAARQRVQDLAVEHEYAKDRAAPGEGVIQRGVIEVAQVAPEPHERAIAARAVGNRRH